MRFIPNRNICVCSISHASSGGLSVVAEARVGISLPFSRTPHIPFSSLSPPLSSAAAATAIAVFFSSCREASYSHGDSLHGHVPGAAQGWMTPEGGWRVCCKEVS